MPSKKIKVKEHYRTIKGIKQLVKAHERIIKQKKTQDQRDYEIAVLRRDLRTKIRMETDVMDSTDPGSIKSLYEEIFQKEKHREKTETFTRAFIRQLALSKRKRWINSIDPKTGFKRKIKSMSKEEIRRRDEYNRKLSNAYNPSIPGQTRKALRKKASRARRS